MDSTLLCNICLLDKTLTAKVMKAYNLHYLVSTCVVSKTRNLKMFPTLPAIIKKIKIIYEYFTGLHTPAIEIIYF